MPKRKYGHIPSKKDDRDFKMIAPRQLVAALPGSVDLRDKMPPIWDQQDQGSCFPAGTLIRMADGTEKAIEQIKTTDYVVTAESRTGMVSATMVRTENKELVVLKLWGHNRLRVTANHPILTRRGYVSAEELRKEDYVAMPRYAPAREPNAVILTDEHIEHRRILRPAHRVSGSVIGRFVTTILTKPVPDAIHLTPQFGRIIGLFLSEGSTSKSRVVWTFGAHERDTLVAELAGLLRVGCDVEPRIQPRPNNSINVIIDGVDWAKLFESLCGNGAGEKRLHPHLMRGSNEFLGAMIGGWLDGDGCVLEKHPGNKGRKIKRQQGRIPEGAPVVGTTVSHQLAVTMFDIGQILGRRPTLTHSNPKISHGVKTRRARWNVSFMATKDDWRTEQTDTHVYRRVREIKKEEFSGHVFNFSVEGDQSYVAEGIGVHNCVAHATGAAFAYDLIVKGDPPLMPARDFIYYNARDIEGTTDQDAGCEPRDALNAINGLGVPDESLWAYSDADLLAKPGLEVYQDATAHASIVYNAVDQSSEGLRAALASGLPVIIGIQAYASLESDAVAASGIIPMPATNEECLGGHSMLLAGYQTNADNSISYITRNSWGPEWGQAGYCIIQEAYLLNPTLCSDLWCLQSCN